MHAINNKFEYDYVIIKPFSNKLVYLKKTKHVLHKYTVLQTLNGNFSCGLKYILCLFP